MNICSEHFCQLGSKEIPAVRRKGNEDVQNFFLMYNYSPLTCSAPPPRTPHPPPPTLSSDPTNQTLWTKISFVCKTYKMTISRPVSIREASYIGL
jgi:hypothetical protein